MAKKINLITDCPLEDAEPKEEKSLIDKLIDAIRKIGKEEQEYIDWKTNNGWYYNSLIDKWDNPGAFRPITDKELREKYKKDNENDKPIMNPRLEQLRKNIPEETKRKVELAHAKAEEAIGFGEWILKHEWQVGVRVWFTWKQNDYGFLSMLDKTTTELYDEYLKSKT